MPAITLLLCPCTSRSVAALDQAGVADEDIQIRSLIIHRLDWGDRKGQHQAGNTIDVTVRDVDRGTVQLSQCRVPLPVYQSCDMTTLPTCLRSSKWR